MQTLLKAADSGDALPPRLPGEEEDDDEEDDEGQVGTSPQGRRGSKTAGSGGPLGPSNSSNNNAAAPGKKPAADEPHSAMSNDAGPAQVPFGPPPQPSTNLGDASVAFDRLNTANLVRELQRLLNSRETDLKRLLVQPAGLRHEVQCDVVRVGSGNTYRCYLRLNGRNDKRLCVFEACRTRKGKLKNSEYRIMLPAADPRMVPTEFGPVNEMSKEALDAALYCGKVRMHLRASPCISVHLRASPAFHGLL